MNAVNKQRLIAFYGDDFTGSTDALEFLSRAGAKTVLFIEPPTAAILQNYSGLDAFGIAGMTRAMAPEDMEQTLRPAFTQLAKLNVAHVHYKVCSTFDSSPTVGSIGKAIDVGSEVFRNRFIPLLVAAPALGRYCVFGNLFARMGIGSAGNIYRLDRHPSMSKHPVTPADESDLRLHLAKQTKKKVGLLDILTIVKPQPQLDEAIEALSQERNEVVLIDALYKEQLVTIGELLVNEARKGKTLFSVGSSGVEMALGAYWNKENILYQKKDWPPIKPVSSLLVLSGSCSPVSTKQIAWAKENGFKEIVINASECATGSDPSLQEYIDIASSSLAHNENVIVHTGGDNKTASFNRQQTANLGMALGKIGRAVIEKAGVKRMVIAGGDTSSYAARALGIEAVEMIAPFAPGAPLCKVHAPNTPVDGLEINVKGGQVGDVDYFGLLAQGTMMKIIS